MVLGSGGFSSAPESVTLCLAPSTCYGEEAIAVTCRKGMTAP